jgi:hypothetical protein
MKVMKYISLLVLLLISYPVISQNKSIHQAESEYYAAFGDRPAAFWDSLSGYKPAEWNAGKTCNLNKIVFGWHPYWVGSVYTNYQWNLLSHFCFFSYDVNASTGNASSTHSFATDPSIDAALANNVKVQLCVVLFSDHATFFGSSTAPQTLITNLISLVQSRGIHGVNIDFEGVPSTQRTNLTNFMISLCNQMHAAVPGSEVSICLPAVDWSGTFDVAAMNSYVDQFCIMGYDYYYGGSGTAGPTSPTYSFETNSILNISRSVTYYLNKNVTHSKLVLGLPYFSFDYPTSSSAVPSATTAAGASRTFKTIHANASGYYSTANKQWSPNSYVPYYIYNNGSWHQCHIDDDYSFGKKLDVVLKRGIGGIAIWALGYDDGYPYYWNKINEKLTDCYYTPCQDTIFDMGGPNGKYFDNENYTYTLAPQNATGLTLAFTQFDVEANYDTLWLYDGPATTAPLIGSYTGTNSPGTVSSSGGALTLRFKSDGATTNPGFFATLQCAIDNIAPTTVVDAGNWQTQDFAATFTDNDNIQIGKRFFQVMDNDGSEWRANGNHGFFNDNFGSVIHPDWTTVTGDWSLTGGHLAQTNEALTNTNIYATVHQSAPYEYLYHWQMYIDGAQANKRAGFHFFCDNPDSTNRNNSYFIWFRLGATPYVELYKVTANVFSMVHYASYPIAAATWYDVKVMFSPVSGKMEVYINNVFLTSWTDTSPWQSGIAISPRTGNSATQYDDVKVYRSRTTGEQITVGSPASMVRYQNSSPSLPSCRIRSLVADVNHNLATSSADVNIDWTAPHDVQVFDGPAADIDTSFSLTEMDGNWTASSDPHSGLVQYHYAIGTQPLTNDIAGWTATTDLFAHISGLSLTDGETYYFTVRAENGAGLLSSDSASNGQVAWFPVSAEQVEMNSELLVFPNPAHTTIFIVCRDVITNVRITDINGKTVTSEKVSQGNNLRLNIENLPEGCYRVLVNGKYSANIVKN